MYTKKQSLVKYTKENLLIRIDREFASITEQCSIILDEPCFSRKEYEKYIYIQAGLLKLRNHVKKGGLNTLSETDLRYVNSQGFMRDYKKNCIRTEKDIDSIFSFVREVRETA